MTYKELQQELNKLSNEQLNMDITIRIEDEYYPMKKFEITSKEPDILDGNHPALAITN